MLTLVGRKVLILEDEFVLALLLEDMLAELGVSKTQHAATIAEARSLVGSEPFDAAILDVNVGGEMSYPVAESLARVGVPVVFVTGYAREAVPKHLANIPLLRKPYMIEDIRGALTRVLGIETAR